MENKFFERFKSKRKISKNSSIFEHLIPIDKQVKQSQIHLEISLSAKNEKFKQEKKFLGPTLKNTKNKAVLLPVIINPESAKSFRDIYQENKELLRKNPNSPDFSLIRKNGSAERYRKKFAFYGRGGRLIQSFDREQRVDLQNQYSKRIFRVNRLK